MGSREGIAEQALVEHLKKNSPDHTLHLPAAGMIVKKTGFIHETGFKRWLLGKPHLFEVHEAAQSEVALC